MFVGRRMAYQVLRVDQCLEGASNIVSWKGRIMILLEDNRVGDCIKNTIPPQQDPQQLAQHNKNDIKTNLIKLILINIVFYQGKSFGFD